MKKSWGNGVARKTADLLKALLTVIAYFYSVHASAVVFKDAFAGNIVAAMPVSVVNPDSTVRLGKQFFGLHIHRAAELPGWPTSQAGGWRLWDAYTSWLDLEPKRGQWNFSRLDYAVNFAAQRGVEILLPLGNTPTWASARPTEACAYGAGCAAEPLNMLDWRNYVRTVATRYKGKIKQFEIWNEVNLKQFYSGSQEQLLELQIAAYEEIKNVDPENILVAPSITGNNTNEISKLDSYLAKGGGTYADVISYHMYTPESSPEALIPLVSEIRRVMRKHGVDKKPLWNTESGWALLNNDGTSFPSPVNPKWRQLNNELGAAYLSRAYILAAVLGVERNYWYAWDNKILGFVDPSTKNPKGAAVAIGNLSTWVKGGAIQRCDMVQGNFWVCQFTHVSGAVRYIVWSANDMQGDFLVPNGWDVREGSSVLNSSYLISNNRSIRIGSVPVMFF